VWPGDSHTPPQGVPEKFNLRITFLEEAPYITLAPPDPITGKCSMNRGVLCRIARGKDTQGYIIEIIFIIIIAIISHSYRIHDVP